LCDGRLADKTKKATRTMKLYSVGKYRMRRQLVTFGIVGAAVILIAGAPTHAQMPRLSPNAGRQPTGPQRVQKLAVRHSPPSGPTHEVVQAPAVMELTLEQAKEQALLHNSQLRLGRLNLQEKQIAIAAARTDYFPKLLGSSAYMHFNDDLGSVVATRERTLGGANIGPGGVIQVPAVTIPGRTISAAVVNQDAAFGAILVAQPITKLIGVSVLVDLARADAAIAHAQLDKGTRELLSGVTQAYYGLLAARQIRTALSLQVEALEPLVKAKPLPELRLGLLEVRKGLVDTDKLIAELTQLLNQLLGFPPCTELALSEAPLPAITIACADEAAALALANNPQVREAQQNILKARAALRAAKMEYLPDVNVIGGYFAQSSADYIQEDFTGIGVTASYTFWDWGKRGHVKRQRETQIALAGQNVRVITETVQLEARKAFFAFKEAEEELAIAKEVVQAREEAEKGVNADVKTLEPLAAMLAKDAAAKELAGKALGTMALTAKAATAKAQLELMQAEVNYRIAHAKLQAAMGQP
jgi:outer membrane protein TolC